jgi:ribonuclease VapC
MFVDASAIVAILTGESDAEVLAGRLEAASQPVTSAVAVFEAAAGVSRKKACSVPVARDFVFRFLSAADVDIVPIREREAVLALEAFDRFGKGRHPAGLNMGDCFAYAGACARGVSLLFKGDDFARTDLGSG